MSRAGSPWPHRDGELRKLWAEGHPTAEIGRRMKLTKNSVVNRADRIGLPRRASPIVRDPNPPPAPSPEAMQRMGAGKDPLPPFHPIAAAVLRGARREW
jgi:GcrA cell cycle regulator